RRGWRLWCSLVPNSMDRFQVPDRRLPGRPGGDAARSDAHRPGRGNVRIRLARALALVAAIGCGNGAVRPAADTGPLADAGVPDAGGPAPDAGPSPDGGIDGGSVGACGAKLPDDAGTPVMVDLDVGDPGEICFAAQPDERGSVPLRVATYD